MKAAVIIQARMGANRLPGKVLLKLSGKTVLEHVIERVLKAKTIDKLIVATTINKLDFKIVKLASSREQFVYCGSENDVLDRYYQAAKLFGLKHIVRITADCPVIDSEIIDYVVIKYFKKRADYCSNILKETFPDGEDVEVFSFKALETAWKKAKLLSEREHVTVYIKKHSDVFNLVSCENKDNLAKKRWTLDTKEDYRFLKILFNNLYKQNIFFGMNEILDFLKKNPRIEFINNGIIRNEGYLISLEKDRNIK